MGRKQKPFQGKNPGFVPESPNRKSFHEQIVIRLSNKWVRSIAFLLEKGKMKRPPTSVS